MHSLSLIDAWNHNHSPELERRTLRRLTARAAIWNLCAVRAALDRQREVVRALAETAHRWVGGLGGARSGGRPSPQRSRRRPGWRSSPVPGCARAASALSL